VLFFGDDGVRVVGVGVAKGVGVVDGDTGGRTAEGLSGSDGEEGARGG
jgi:hypothetical protein